MSPVYDLYQSGHSWLHRLDPRAKLAFVCCGFVLLLVLRNLWVMIIALLVAQGLLLSAHISRQRIVWVWRMVTPTMVMIALLWVLFYRGQGPALISWWFIHISLDNLAAGLTVALRIGALAFVVFVWLFSTDQATLVRGLVALGLPYDWGLTLSMSLRYLPTLANVFRMISEAQQARGLELAKGSPLRRARAYLPITVAMLISSLRTANNLAHALESRALGATAHRSYLRRLRFRPADWLWTSLWLVITLALLWARLAHGLGADPVGLF